MEGISPTVFAWIDVPATAVFAVSGALAAARAKQTLVTFSFFAVLTGIGGGTLRDLLIGAPVFWIIDPLPLAICLSMAVLTWFTPQRLWRSKAIEWFDAIGICIYGVYGAAKALEHGIPALPAVIMGVITACVGGILRDVLAGEPSIVVRPEIYVTAVALGSGTFVLLQLLGASTPTAALVGFALAFILRSLAITKGLALPPYGK